MTPTQALSAVPFVIIGGALLFAMLAFSFAGIALGLAR